MSRKWLITEDDFSEERNYLHKIEELLNERSYHAIGITLLHSYKLLNILSECSTYLPYRGLKISYLYEGEKIYSKFEVVKLHQPNKYDQCQIILSQHDGELLTIYKDVGSRGSRSIACQNEKIFFGFPLVLEWSTLGSNPNISSKISYDDRENILNGFLRSIKELFLIRE